MSVIDITGFSTANRAELDNLIALVDGSMSADPAPSTSEQSRLWREEAALLTRREADVSREAREETRILQQAAQVASREADLTAKARHHNPKIGKAS